MSVGDPEVVSPYVEAFKILETINHDLQDQRIFEEFLALLSTLVIGTPTISTSTSSTSLLSTYTQFSSSAVSDKLDSVLVLARSSPSFGEGLVRLVESYWAQSRVWGVLEDGGYGEDVFQGYLLRLALGSSDAEHEHIMRRVWTWFESKVDGRTVVRLRIAFLEEHVAQSVGVDFEILAEAKEATDDDLLYHDVLDYLAMSQKNNIAWYMIFDMIRSVVLRRKPESWDSLGVILSDWRTDYAAEFLTKARDLISDEVLFAEFSAQYVADADEAVNNPHRWTTQGHDDAAADDLLDQLKRLQITTTAAAGSSGRLQGPRRAIR
ncbi:hypothetical protein HKX48_000501 [Thoreauomyces humboldtii]|nr:hypothetical protein HKX48_000501 [Thoreauomyces humboldtii]